MVRNSTSLNKAKQFLVLLFITTASLIFTTAHAGDTKKPTVKSVSPGNFSITVDMGTTVSVVFSESMNPSTINSSTFELRNALTGSLVNGAIMFDPSGKKATLYPASPLTALLYAGKIKGGASGVKDDAGNPMVKDYTWIFIMFPLFDLTPPAVLSESPADGSSGISPSCEVSVVFSEAMNASTINTTTFKLKNEDGQLIPATVSYNASLRKATLKPLAALSGSGKYKATIKGGGSGVKDTHGNALQSNYKWKFTIDGPSDGVPPVIMSVSPINNSENVSISATLKAVFSEPMNASLINSSTVELMDGSGSPVSAGISYDAATMTANVVPSSPLAYSMSYTAKVKGGATGVKDMAGNAMINDYLWNFSTVPVSIFQVTDLPEVLLQSDAQPVEVGVKFQTDQPGYILGIRFYKGAGNDGTHTGHLWTSSGTMLDEAIFVNETASGWQQVLFANPVLINANTTYIASYFSSLGNYSYTHSYFTSAVVNGPVRALADGEDGGNGVYIFSPTPTVPMLTYQATNYFVDVLFAPSPASNTVVTQKGTNEPAVQGQRGTGDELRQGPMALPEKLLVQAMPNPSTAYFNLAIYSNDANPVTVRVIDISGRIVEVHQKISSTGVLQLGQNWRSGNYFVEVIQGDQKKTLQLVKVN
jgi:Domain of unknown function (DUF4082)/Bacterial Ig-like domain/Secretion system C-terminal sorting domain